MIASTCLVVHVIAFLEIVLLQGYILLLKLCEMGSTFHQADSDAEVQKIFHCSVERFIIK